MESPGLLLSHPTISLTYNITIILIITPQSTDTGTSANSLVMKTRLSQRSLSSSKGSNNNATTNNANIADVNANTASVTITDTAASTSSNIVKKLSKSMGMGMYNNNSKLLPQKIESYTDSFKGGRFLNKSHSTSGIIGIVSGLGKGGKRGFERDSSNINSNSNNKDNGGGGFDDSFYDESAGNDAFDGFADTAGAYYTDMAAVPQQARLNQGTCKLQA